MGVLLEVRGWLSEVGVIEHGGDVGNKKLLLPVPLPPTSRF